VYQHCHQLGKNLNQKQKYFRLIIEYILNKSKLGIDAATATASIV
jgi:hypothetical protein